MLTDVIMPRMNGGQLAARLQDVRPDMRVVFMSGYPDHSIVRHGVLDPRVAFIPKPVTPGALLGRLRQVLEGSQP